MQEVVGAYKDTATPKAVQASGLHIAGQKYIVIKADDTSLYGKKVRPLSSGLPTFGSGIPSKDVAC
jgi:hypothetical protein